MTAYGSVCWEDAVLEVARDNLRSLNGLLAPTVVNPRTLAVVVVGRLWTLRATARLAGAHALAEDLWPAIKWAHSAVDAAQLEEVRRIETRAQRIAAQKKATA
jgi:hypothetical protein